MEKGAFISYSHYDQQSVRELTSMIQNQLQFPIWYDHNLHGGDHYFSVIAEQILKFEYFIFVVSHNSVVSEFCTMELEFAKSEKRKIVAVWLEDLMPPPRVRMVISHTHYIRSFALTKEGLEQELRLALLENQLYSDVTPEREQLSDRYLEGYKYFLRAEEKQKIKYLLQLESQEKFSACFEPDAAVLLGMAYELGIYTERDERQAEFYYRVAAHKGSADGKYLNLSLQLELGKMELAFALQQMRELAEGESLLAKVYFGDDLYKGKHGTRPDKQAAYRLWKMAADQHHPEAQYYTAFGYASGELGEKDYLLALMYARESQEADFPRAYRLIGNMYRNGNFVQKDPDKAIAYFQKAISLGDLLSINYIGDVEYFRDNYELSVVYYRQAMEFADAGKIKSGTPYYNMGYAYYHGQGIEEDERTGIEMMLKASELGKAAAQKETAAFIAESRMNRQERRELLRRASDLNCKNAEYYLGELMVSEDDPAQADYDEALKYYTLGAEKGNPNCMEAAIAFYARYAGEDYTAPYKNREKALSILRLLFAMLDEDRAKMKERMVDSIELESCYYAYITELAIDEENGKPDKELALYYLKKAMEEKCWGYYGFYVSLAQNSLRVGKENYVAEYDPKFGEDVIVTLLEYLPQVCEKYRNEKSIDNILDRLSQCIRQLLILYMNSEDRYVAGQTLEERKYKILTCGKWQDEIAQIRKLRSE